MSEKQQLHEIIAVEKDVHSQIQSIMNESIKIFKEPKNFISFHKTYEPYLDDTTLYPDERLEMKTNVLDRINYTFKYIINYYDIAAKKEATNCMAKADLIVDGETIIENLPATLLLTLEKEFKQLLVVWKTLPTLPAQSEWETDPNAKKGVVRLKHPHKRIRTKRVPDIITLAPATKEHPAQVTQGEKEINEGIWTQNEWCGSVSSAYKARMLENIELLIRGAKKARMRANKQEVSHLKIGKLIKNFIISHEPIEE